MERNSRKFLIGVVTSNKMQKTITVKIETKFKHPLYRQLVIHNKKYHVHQIFPLTLNLHFFQNH